MLPASAALTLTPFRARALQPQVDELAAAVQDDKEENPTVLFHDRNEAWVRAGIDGVFGDKTTTFNNMLDLILHSTEYSTSDIRPGAFLASSR